MLVRSFEGIVMLFVCVCVCVGFGFGFVFGYGIISGRRFVFAMPLSPMTLDDFGMWIYFCAHAGN